MKRTTPLEGLARWVHQRLQGLVRLDKSLTDHLEATFGSADMTAIVADPTGSESASFLELLFFPDASARLEFEHRWGASVYSKKDQDTLVRSLTDRPVTASICPADATAPLKLRVPEFVLAAFVQRLNITWQPTTALRDMLERAVTVEQIPAIRYRLRHLRLVWNPAQIELVERFLTRFPIDAQDFDTCFDGLTTLLAELGTDEDPFAFLVAQKFFFFQALCKAEHFERLRQTSNMETLMLQGARAAQGSTAQWREQMRLVDRICESLYGQTRFFREPDERALDAPRRADARQMADLVRWLG
jgi:hypothetical protein